MKWSETISVTEPLRNVISLAGAPQQGWEAFLYTREQEAHARGWREGEQSLREQLVEQRAELAQMQQGILKSLNGAVSQVLRETETAVIGLALQAAQKLVAGLPISPELIEAVVREALRQLEESSNVTVQLHPDDLALLRKNGSPLLGDPGTAGPVRFTASPEVTRGGCRIETRFGTLDACRETKLQQLRQSLGL